VILACRSLTDVRKIRETARLSGDDVLPGFEAVFDIGQLEFFDDPVFQVLERGADRITIYRDPDRLEAELLPRAPQDAAAVTEFVGLVRKIAKLRMPEGDFGSSSRGEGEHGGLALHARHGHPAPPVRAPGPEEFRVGQWIAPGGGLPSGLMTAPVSRWREAWLADPVR
jgi:hypothetical protein